jgi:hypothetical protein
MKKLILGLMIFTKSLTAMSDMPVQKQQVNAYGKTKQAAEVIYKHFSAAGLAVKDLAKGVAGWAELFGLATYIGVSYGVNQLVTVVNKAGKNLYALINNDKEIFCNQFDEIVEKVGHDQKRILIVQIQNSKEQLTGLSAERLELEKRLLNVTTQINGFNSKWQKVKNFVGFGYFKKDQEMLKQLDIQKKTLEKELDQIKSTELQISDKSFQDLRKLYLMNEKMDSNKK